MIYDNIVVGSSISALGCIIGLLESKKKVLCIDASNDNLNIKKNNQSDEIIFCEQKLPLKNFAFKKKSNKIFKPLEVLESQSFGGLLNVWGGNCLRFIKDDFNNWPISYNVLKKYYETCEKIMNVSHFDDEISKELEIEKNVMDFEKSILFSDFIKKFLKNKKNSKNYSIGLARVALDSKCYKCSNCFFGCKDNYIITAKNYLKKLISEKKIEYKNNLNLKKFVNKNDLIELEFKNTENTKLLTKKLFIGAGALQTPKIVINSLNKKKDLFLKESQPFYIPSIYLGKNFNNDFKHHTLSQAHVFFKNNIKHNVGKIHYEIKYDQKITNISLKKQFGFLYKLIPNLLKKRIFVITGFINSNHSTYSAKIKKENLEIEIIKNKNNEKKIKFEIFNQLKILEKNFTFVTIKSFLKLGNFGRGFHLGGSIPMINDDKINQMKSDDLYSKKNGEIAKYKNVFIIDSTNFTNIPAGSTSLTIMANALRIGAESSND